MTGPALEVRGLSKVFASQRALDDVDLTVEPGEIRALLGQNGSGKSTLIKILSGFYKPGGGTVSVAGQDLAFGNPVSAERAGLRFVHQDLGLVAGLSVIDNLALGHGYSASSRFRIQWRREEAVARSALLTLGFDIDPRRHVSELSVSQRTAVAIARALSPRRGQTVLLVLDEPTANLPSTDADAILRLMQRVSEAGVGVLFVSHHLDELSRVADSVTVLRDGQAVATSAMRDVTQDTLVRLMTGRALRDQAWRTSTPGEAVLAVEDLTGDVVRQAGFTVRAGEIVGIAGLTGSGREELAELVYGSRPRRGRITVSGREIPPMAPHVSSALGIGLVPADRHANAILTDGSVRENIGIANPRRHLRRGAISRRSEKRDIGGWLARLAVVPQQTERPASTLSGGNQQKVILARWLRHGSKVLVLDDPTQGIDIAAKAEIYAQLNEVAASGTAVLLVSSDNEEICLISDRVLVLRSGRFVAEFTGQEADPEQVTLAGSGTPSATGPSEGPENLSKANPGDHS
jgi:ribose transport system ATP-binding protein